MIQRPTIKLNRSAIILVIVVIALIGGGWALGYTMGTDHGKLVAVQNPPRQQTVNGTVKTADTKGMTVETTSGEWKVVYSDTTEFRSGLTATKSADIKKGDTVRVNGTTGGDSKGKTLNARTVLKTTPRSSATPSAGAKPAEAEQTKPPPKQP